MTDDSGEMMQEVPTNRRAVPRHVRVEHSTNGILLLDRDGRRLYVSPTFSTILGYTPDELQQLDLWAINPPDEQPAASEAFRQLLDQPGASIMLRLRAHHKDGSVRRLENTLTNLLEEPSIHAVIMNIRDVTEELDARARVRRARDQLFAVLSAVSDGIIVQAENGSLLYANQAAAELCGLPTVQALLALPVAEILARFEIVDEQGQPLAWEDLPARRVFAGEERAEATIGVRSSAGGEDRWAFVTTGAIHDWLTNNRLAVSLFRDITRQHLLETAQQEAISARDRFLSVASHELRTPLTALKAQAQLTERQLLRGAPAESMLEAMTLINRQVARLEQLVGDLLDVSRLESGAFTAALRPTDAAELVTRVVEEQRTLSLANPITLELPEEPVYLAADPLKLEQALGNLVQNARKYSPTGAPIAVHLAVDGAAGYIRVRDRGIGVPADDLPLIFEPFHRGGNVDGATGGLGLGLYIAREIVRAHDGEITAESEPGRGTTFTITLRRWPADTPDGQPLD